VLNRPHKRNALTELMWAQLPALLNDIEDKCRVLLVRGIGGSFSSGADISEFDEIYATQVRGHENSRCIAAGLDALSNFPHPTIAVVRGSCIGGGCGVAIACDFRFADDTARFSITPAKMGLVYPFNDTKRLVDTVGASRAKDILFSARQLDAQEALLFGLADHVTTADNLDNLVTSYVDRLLKMSPRSTDVTKRMINLAIAGQDNDNKETKELFENSFQSKDFKEGYRAFLEKRKPNFSD
jgi:enoyl-CoA hydratase/carnithine racemase